MEKINRRNFLKTSATVLGGSAFLITVGGIAVRHCMKVATTEATLIMEGLGKGRPLAEFFKECQALLSDTPSRKPVLFAEMDDDTIVMLVVDRSAGTIGVWKGVTARETGDEGTYRLERFGVYKKDGKSLTPDEAEAIWTAGEKIIRENFEVTKPSRARPKGSLTI